MGSTTGDNSRGKALNVVTESTADYWCPADRYHSANLTRNANGVQLLEVRMHEGTAEHQGIATWISFWMHVLNHSLSAQCQDPEFGRVLPKGNATIGRREVAGEDIFLLLQREGIVLPAPLKRLLWERRRQLRASWTRAVPNRVASWTKAGWYDADVHA